MAYAHTKVKPCNCPAYSWPHRLDGGACKALYNSDVLTEDYRAGIVRDFDKTEARAINANRELLK